MACAQVDTAKVFVGGWRKCARSQSSRHFTAAPLLLGLRFASLLLRHGPQLRGDLRYLVLPGRGVRRDRPGGAAGRDLRQPQLRGPLLRGFPHLHGLDHHLPQLGVVGAVVHGQRPVVLGGTPRLPGHQLHSLGQEVVREALLHKWEQIQGEGEETAAAADERERARLRRRRLAAGAVSGFVGRARRQRIRVRS